MKQRSLLSRILWQFSLRLIGVFLLATPLFYYLTKHFYAEDMEDLIEAVRAGQDIPKLDLEADIMTGVMIQYFVILLVLGVAVLLTLRSLTHKLWKPFEHTLRQIEQFNLTQSTLPDLREESTREFSRLNQALLRLLQRDRRIYQAQKEFTENASHELQTPLAIIRSKLDLLIQTEHDEQTSALIDSLYQLNTRMERLNRNLLLLAKIENGQYQITEDIPLRGFVGSLLEGYHSLCPQIDFQAEAGCHPKVKANAILLECLLNNLVANAIRHTIDSESPITITLNAHSLSVSNFAQGKALDADSLFERFHKGDAGEKGCGLGLAIVKAICDYHRWTIDYRFLPDRCHCFMIKFF